VAPHYSQMHIQLRIFDSHRCQANHGSH
jgi:hypothetical protein